MELPVLPQPVAVAVTVLTCVGVNHVPEGVGVALGEFVGMLVGVGVGLGAAGEGV